MGKKEKKTDTVEKLLGFDIFGSSVGFTFVGGHSTHGSWIGLFLTVAISGLVLAYLIKRHTDLTTGSDTYHS
jgi:hypothetical protein